MQAWLRAAKWFKFNFIEDRPALSLSLSLSLSISLSLSCYTFKHIVFLAEPHMNGTQH